MQGTLYIVATPIGNLEDITLRAIKILNDVDIILAEDTRVSTRLLNAISAISLQSLAISHRPATKDQRLKTSDQRLISYHQHSSDAKKLEILKYLQEGKNIALVTDAGTPGVSDPGNELIDFLLNYEPDLKIIPIPGASALTAALSVSGFRTDKFLFIGYWPRKKVTKLVKLIKLIKVPIVFYESPYRILKTLDLIDKELPDNRVLIGRELTKIHESLYRGMVDKVIDKLLNDSQKGEFVVILENRDTNIG